MNLPPHTDDPTSRAATEPDIPALQEEYLRAWNDDPNAIDRIAAAEDIRYTRWSGQSRDGLKWQANATEGTVVRPYDGAPDCRIHLADEVINSLVDLMVSAFWNARPQAKPLHASTLTSMQSAELRAVMSWILHGALRHELTREVELAAQVAQTLGHVVLHTTWLRREELQMQRVALDELLALAEQSQDAEFTAAVQSVGDPAMQDVAVAYLQRLYPNLSRRRAVRVIADLRKTGEAEFPVPQVVENRPQIAVLIPWQDVVVPLETTELQSARAIFRREYLSQADVETRAREEEWEDAFTEQLPSTRGLKHGADDAEQSFYDVNSRLIEVVYAYTRAVDEDGVPGIWCTVFSPHLGSSPGSQTAYGKHYLVGHAHGKQPFTEYAAEITGRRLQDARGVPDVVVTEQASVKRHRDLLDVNAQLSTCPPLVKRGMRASKLPPELGPLGIINAQMGGEWEWFPPPKGQPELAFTLVETVRREVLDYYGLEHEKSIPKRALARQQRLVNQWLLSWAEALWQAAVLTYQYLSPEELEQILGREATLTAAQLARYRVLLWFDVRAMDAEWVLEMVKAMNEFVLPADAAGTVDRAKFVQWIMAYFDPTLAQEVTMDQQAASNAMFEKVRNDVAQMALGNEALYTENDPAAQAKMNFLQQTVMANPKYQAAIQSDERFRMLLEKYQQNLQQSVMQEQNKQVGKLGVQPEAMGQ